jgi:hypothetical protein
MLSLRRLFESEKGVCLERRMKERTMSCVYTHTVSSEERREHLSEIETSAVVFEAPEEYM